MSLVFTERCFMCFDYDDTADISDSRIVKCRKQHKCEGCARWIEKGEQAECHSGLFDGAWYRYYVCNGCQRVIMAIAVNELREGCAWHTAWIHPSDLAQYRFDMRRCGEEIRPLGMPTLQDCRRVVNDVFELSRAHWWRKELMALEAF